MRCPARECRFEDRGDPIAMHGVGVHRHPAPGRLSRRDQPVATDELVLVEHFPVEAVGASDRAEHNEAHVRAIERGPRELPHIGFSQHNPSIGGPKCVAEAIKARGSRARPAWSIRPNSARLDTLALGEHLDPSSCQAGFGRSRCRCRERSPGFGAARRRRVPAPGGEAPRRARRCRRTERAQQPGGSHDGVRRRAARARHLVGVARIPRCRRTHRRGRMSRRSSVRASRVGSSSVGPMPNREPSVCTRGCAHTRPR